MPDVSVPVPSPVDEVASAPVSVPVSVPSPAIDTMVGSADWPEVLVVLPHAVSRVMALTAASR